ncbi:MAG: PAS domain-containing protein, partial [Desulfobacterales bacterium]|nr:PAS domain-containing protein [Desulfobacterales bacterium]
MTDATDNLPQQLEALRTELDRIQRREADLKEAAAQWQVTFDAIADAICVLDADHRIVRMNRAMGQLVGRSEAEAVGHHCWELVHGTDRPPESCPCQNVRRFLKRHNALIEHNQHWIDVTIEPRFD